MNWRLFAAAGLLFFLGYRLNQPGSGGRLKLVESAFAFGTIDTSTVAHAFTVVNVGDDELTIKDVQTSCGCMATVLYKKILAPGDSTILNVTLDPKGKAAGPIDKTVWITTDSREQPNDSIMLTATIAAIHADRMMTVGNIFTGDCRKCHVNKGEGQFGAELFANDCKMCHAYSPKAHAPDVAKLSNLHLPKDTLLHRIAHGKPGTNMPAFAAAHGGPLTDAQINSLVEYLSHH